FIYVPILQIPHSHPSFLIVRDARLDATASLQPAVRATLLSFDRHLPLVTMMPLTGYAGLGLIAQKIGAAVAATLGALALLLAVMGVRGVMAFRVSGRPREIGMRRALGADRRQLMRLVLGRGLRLALTGGVLGVGAALVAAPLLGDFLFGISPADPIAFGATV